AAGGAGVIDHLVHAGFERVGPAGDDHGNGIAHEEDVHAGLVEQTGSRIIVGGEGNDFLAALLHGGERRDSDLLGHMTSVSVPRVQGSKRCERIAVLVYVRGGVRVEERRWVGLRASDWRSRLSRKSRKLSRGS